MFRKFIKNITDGQQLETNSNKNNSKFYKLIVYKRPKIAGILIPALTINFFWLSYIISTNQVYLFNSKYVMTLTMIAGSMIAGATSEGGGAVAFPIMTLLLKISPTIARDFSLMIQSFGMTAAVFTILYQRIKLEWNALIWSSLGGIIGIPIGFVYIVSYITSAANKIIFVSVWLAFAISLFILNIDRERLVYKEIQYFNLWKRVVLISFGFFGGILTSISGSGIDIASFSCLTLLFRVSEKTATPTSVVIMAINTCVGFYFKYFWFGGIDQEAFEYLIVCIPVVVLGGPFGAFIGSYFHRLILAIMIYIINIVQYIGACFIIFNNGNNKDLIIVSVVTIGSGWTFFVVLSLMGKRLLYHYKLIENRRNVIEVI